MTPEPGSPSVTPAELRDRFLDYLKFIRGLDLPYSTPADRLEALELAVRETLIERAGATWRTQERERPKTVHYLSMEYLLGRLLEVNLLATGLMAPARQAMESIGVDLDELMEAEPDPGLGNGGLGRLAACYLESLATLGYPAYGYGLRYDYGIFRQELEGGWQVERPDDWLEHGAAWEIRRPNMKVPVRIGGHIAWHQVDGGVEPRWEGWRTFSGIPHDLYVAGHGTPNVAVLRLWRAQAAQEFDFHIFARGDFVRAVEERERVEAITKVLYPSDDTEAGRRLRLRQEYFLVACSIYDMIERFRRRFDDRWEKLPEAVAIQLNDTHPALAVVELMRTLIDDHGLEWDPAWDLVRRCCGYTNHTLLPEALEVWPAALLEELLPRHLQIIDEINRRFLDEVRTTFPDNVGKVGRMSIVGHSADRRVRMAHLSIVGSHKVNGVARLHTELLTTKVVPDFAEMYPDRFLPITNGITPRRWLLASNPRLAAAITERIGAGWETDLDRLEALAPAADDPAFRAEVRRIKRACKDDLAAWLRETVGVEVDPSSLFDVQIKRLHEYKRQLLCAMHVLALYRRIKLDPDADIVPRTVLFGAKAAPAYHMAKLVIRLITSIGETLDADPDVRGRLKVVFVPDYRVSVAERIIPAADLSEQISTAGKEASGTGNMKLALNGALTIGTLDGANVEILEAVGEENIFIFGHTAEEVTELRTSAHDPHGQLRDDEELAGVMEMLRTGATVGGDAALLRPIWAALMEGGDPYLHLADFRSYVDAQARVEERYRDQEAWSAAAIRNIAGMGRFSSDRAIRQYADLVWGIEPLPVDPSMLDDVVSPADGTVG